MTHSPAAAPPAATRHDLDLADIEHLIDRVRVCIRGVRLALRAGDAKLTRELCDQIRTLFEFAGGTVEHIGDSEASA